MKISLPRICGIAAMLLFCTALHAETKDDVLNRRHEVRISWSDQIFESFNWRNPAYTVNNMDESVRLTKKEHYRYTQHWALNYQYRLKSWLGVGLMFDASACLWDNVTRNGKGVETGRVKNQHFANVAIVPTVRFTYVHHKYVNVYSGIGYGLNINTGSELNAFGKATEYSGALNLTFVGLSGNYGKWFAAFELGGLYAARSAQAVYMLNSRLFTIGLGMRF